MCFGAACGQGKVTVYKVTNELWILSKNSRQNLEMVHLFRKKIFELSNYFKLKYN